MPAADRGSTAPGYVCPLGPAAPSGSGSLLLLILRPKSFLIPQDRRNFNISAAFFIANYQSFNPQQTWRSHVISNRHSAQTPQPCLFVQRSKALRQRETALIDTISDAVDLRSEDVVHDDRDSRSTDTKSRVI